MTCFAVRLVLALLAGSVGATAAFAADGDDADMGPLLPLVVGNHWTYEQRTTSGDSTRVIEQTTSIVAQDTLGAYVFFRALTELPDGESSSMYTARSDSIFQVVPRANGDAGLALMYFVPQGTQDFKSWWTEEMAVDWTAAPVDTAVTTPSGTYQGCYSFKHRSANVATTVILAPNVGVVQQEILQWRNGKLQDRTEIKLTKFDSAP